MRLNGKVAVIAGATGGLGRVVTTRLADEGARLVLLGRSKERLNRLLSDLGLDRKQHITASSDLTKAKGLAEIASGVQEKFGRADLLINLVGGWVGGKTVVDLSAGWVQEMLAQHLWSTYHLAQAFVPLMVENDFGRVIVVTSPTATKPKAKSGAYAVGKAAQEALMMTLAAELKGSGVTANVIQVSTIDTEHKRETVGDPKYAGWTTPEEIANAIVYLTSEDAKQLNGIRLPMYG
jgi:NAD(P)-dependent dehydrogenase (short-subunit alcohol dehydrogenase family)